MPRLEILDGFHIAVSKATEPDAGGDGDTVGTVEVWTLVFTDRQTRDQIRISFRKDTRDALVRQLTGGIVLAGGELPSV